MIFAPLQRIAMPALAVLLCLYVLAVNGALVGLEMPTTTQALWMGGFAQSFANSWSIYAHDFGAPAATPIVFGLPGALTAAVFIKLGLSMPDAYTAACAAWFILAFWGAVQLLRHFRIRSIWALLFATLWLTLPVVWTHADYSMLYVGIALLPTYIWSCVAFADAPRFQWGLALTLAVLSIAALFTDGYTFVMFALGASVLWMFRIWRRLRRGELPDFVRIGWSVGCLAAAYLLFTAYVGKNGFEVAGLGFFRAWGADLSFLAVPSRGYLWLPDLLGLSTSRQRAQFFGDASVWRSVFSLPYVAAAIALFFAPYGDPRVKASFLLVGIATLYLSLGPSFKFGAVAPPGMWSGMPESYALGPTGTGWLSQYVPGFKNMRASYRWIALALCCFLVVITLALGSRKTPKGLAIAGAIVLFAIGFPHLGRLSFHYQDNRRELLQIDADLKASAPIFGKGELVAFLPYGNDFLINYAAPAMGIRAFNTGGDKNITMARESWPAVLAASKRNDRNNPTALDVDPSVVDTAIQLLAEGSADAVALPFVDIMMSRDLWPQPASFADTLGWVATALATSDLFEVKQDARFAVVHLSQLAKSLSPQARLARLGQQGGLDAIVQKVCDLSGGEEWIELGTTILANLEAANPFCSIFTSGWSSPEGWGIWSNGPRSQLRIKLTAQPDGDVRLYLAMHGYSRSDHQTVAISSRGIPITTLTAATGADLPYTITVPNRLVANGEILLDLTMQDPVSPKDLGQGLDERVLGIGLRSVGVFAAL